MGRWRVCVRNLFFRARRRFANTLVASISIAAASVRTRIQEFVLNAFGALLRCVQANDQEFDVFALANGNGACIREALSMKVAHDCQCFFAFLQASEWSDANKTRYFICWGNAKATYPLVCSSGCRRLRRVVVISVGRNLKFLLKRSGTQALRCV